jgi:hypothetical protein
MMRTFLKALVRALALSLPCTASSPNSTTVALSQHTSISTINSTFPPAVLSALPTPATTPWQIQTTSSGTACADSFEEMVTLVVGPNRTKVSAHAWAWRRVNFTPECPETWIPWQTAHCTIERPFDDVEAWKELRHWAYNGNFTYDAKKLWKEYMHADSDSLQACGEMYRLAVMRHMRVYLLAIKLSAEEIANTVMDTFVDLPLVNAVSLLQPLVQLVLESEVARESPIRSFIMHEVAFEALFYRRSWSDWKRLALILDEYQFYMADLDRAEFLIDTMMQFPGGVPRLWNEPKCQWHVHDKTPNCTALSSSSKALTAKGRPEIPVQATWWQRLLVYSGCG